MKVLYRLDENAEADHTYFFCSDECRDKFEACLIGEETIFGENNDAIEGTSCDECEKEIEQ